MGRDTGEQEEEGPKVERLVEEESKKEGEEEEGRAVEERTRRKIHSILESKFGFNRWIQCFKKISHFDFERSSCQKVVDVNDRWAEEGSDEFFLGRRGGEVPGEDAQEGMEQAGDEAVLLSLFWCLTQERDWDTGSAECVCSTGALECR